MQSCRFWLRAAPRPLGSLFGSFHHAERAPRVISSLTAESPTIQELQTSLVAVQGFSPPVSCAQGRLVKALDSLKKLAASILPQGSPSLSRDGYTIGWISALATTAASVAAAFLDGAVMDEKAFLPLKL